MKLVHKLTGIEVKLHDQIRSSKGELATVEYFRKPSSPASEGKITVSGKRIDGEFYVSVFGLEWIDRKDRGKVVRCTSCGSHLNKKGGCTNGDCHHFTPEL